MSRHDVVSAVMGVVNAIMAAEFVVLAVLAMTGLGVPPLLAWGTASLVLARGTEVAT